MPKYIDKHGHVSSLASSGAVEAETCLLCGELPDSWYLEETLDYTNWSTIPGLNEGDPPFKVCPDCDAHTQLRVYHRASTTTTQ